MTGSPKKFRDMRAPPIVLGAERSTQRWPALFYLMSTSKAVLDVIGTSRVCCASLF